MSEKVETNLHAVEMLWADAYLEGFQVDYDAIRVKLRETTGEAIVLECLGHIGHEFIGVWDEFIVEGAQILNEHEFIDRCVISISDRLGEDPLPTGSSARNRRSWSMLQIRFLDGSTLDIVAAAFSARREGTSA